MVSSSRSALLPALAFATRLAPHLPASVSLPQLAALRHLVTTSPLNTGRCATLIRALMVPGSVDPASCEIAEVSVTRDGRARTSRYSRLLIGRPRTEQFGHARVLVADQPLEILPLGMRRVGWRVERIERDMAGTAGSADQEWRLDRAIGQPTDALIGGDAGLVDQWAVKAGPASGFAIQGLPLAASKRGLGNLRIPSAPVEVPNLRSQAECRWSSLPPWLCGSSGSRGRILEAAGRVDVARTCRHTSGARRRQDTSRSHRFPPPTWPGSRDRRFAARGIV